MSNPPLPIPLAFSDKLSEINHRSTRGTVYVCWLMLTIFLFLVALALSNQIGKLETTLKATDLKLDMIEKQLGMTQDEP